MARASRVFLTMAVSSRSDTWVAALALLLSLVVFAAIAPFADVPLPPLPAFIPAYESALVVCDLITAALLYGQYTLLRSRPLLLLAGGYWFCAVIAFIHMLSFPNVITPAGLFGGGTQTTAWLYVCWHLVFPLFIIGYVVTAWRERDGPATVTPGGTSPWKILVAGGVAIAALAAMFLLFSVTAVEFLPPLIAADRHFAPALRVAVALVVVLALTALGMLALRKPHTVLDLWLMVVMCAWTIDMALAAALNVASFDLGWYAGRIYGLLASTAVLVMLLLESNATFGRLVEVSTELSNANADLERVSRQDALTRIANRRSFDEYLVQQVAIARRFKRPLGLIVCDVDAFKAYNDHFGHPAGDECLRRIAEALQSCCRRPADMAARYGGEEFAMILPDTTLAGAMEVGRALEHAIAQLHIAHPTSTTLPQISISGGVAALSGRFDRTAEQLVASADKSLYIAKFTGRNRIVAEVPETV